MTLQELKTILEKHQLWLENKPGGERANLSRANLSRADLSCADLSCADLSKADLSRADLSRANLRDADLRDAGLRDADLRDADLSRADLSRADLSRANLSGADLRDAALDYSCLPLWCGSLSAHFDDKQIIQIVYHAIKAGLNSKNTSDEVKTELKKLIPLANKFHRVDECGWIEDNSVKENTNEKKRISESKF